LVNKLDVIIKKKKDTTWVLTDVAVPLDRDVIKMEAEKKNKYKHVSREIHRMWNVKCFLHVHQ
jgi:hypothetical protein